MTNSSEKKGVFDRFKEMWYFTPIGMRAIVLALILIVGFMMLMGNPKVEKANKKVQQLELEKLQLELKLQEQVAITDTLVAHADKRLKDFNKQRELIENQIKVKYDEKRDIVSHQPIDSAISILSKWLSETDNLQRR